MDDHTIAARNSILHVVGDARPLADMPGTSRPAASPKEGRGYFFAINKDAFAKAAQLGVNEAITYLIMARGSLSDNRTTSWSKNAVDERTRIPRNKVKETFSRLLEEKVIELDEASLKTKPRYRLFPKPKSQFDAPGLRRLNKKQLRLMELMPLQRLPETVEEDEVLQQLEHEGWATCDDSGSWHIGSRVKRKAAPIHWVWLPNSIIDGIHDGQTPVELLRQCQDVDVITLFVSLYDCHDLNFTCGIDRQALRRSYTRQKLEEFGAFELYAFTKDTLLCDPEASFVQPYLEQKGEELGLSKFWDDISKLERLGLLTFVPHLVESGKGEIIMPLNAPRSGRDVTAAEERLYKEVREASLRMMKAHSLGLPGGVPEGAILAPVQNHISKVRLVGIARLRHRPKTLVTAEWFAQSDRWDELAEFYQRVCNPSLTAANGNGKPETMRYAG